MAIVVTAAVVFGLMAQQPPPPVTCSSTDIPPACSAGPSEGTLCTTTADTLRPTQASLGMLLVSCKTSHFNGKSSQKQASYLQDHVIPAVIGPEGTLFITDHHHLSRAVLNSNAPGSTVYVCPQRDFSRLAHNLTSFWSLMKKEKLVWMEDNTGAPLSSVKDIPSAVANIKLDDPYRTMSEWVRD
eukprot:gene6476-256_t